MSGLPIDFVDTGAGSFYGLSNGTSPLARPSLAAGMSCSNANQNVPAGSFFNATVFARPTVQSGQPIPSSGGTATAGAMGTDIGNVGRNCLRGPRQVNLDFSIAKLFPIAESRNFEFRAEFFNLFNHSNLANPISNLNALIASSGTVDQTTRRDLNPRHFCPNNATSHQPRQLQFAR